MSTGSKLESTASGGVGGIKDRLKALQDGIKEHEEKAEACLKEKERVHRNYCKTTGKQQQLKDKISSTEEEIAKVEKKCKDTQDRLRNKEEFLTELSSFNKKLTKVAPGEGDAVQREKQLNEYKSIYNKSHEKYMHAKEQKIDLEHRFEQLETRSRDVQRRVDSLKQELENNLVEEGRRGEQCKQSMDSAFRIERNIIGVQKMLDDMMKRKENATKRVNALREKITQTEDEHEETCHERRCIEATIREILLGKSKE